ncbi:MAG: Nre family DNA repair protein [Candidatus Bathyarchaeales archaeon]
MNKFLFEISRLNLDVSHKRGDRAYPNVWLLDVLKGSGLPSDINYGESQLLVRASRSGLCVACKGARFLCGKTRCPIVVKANFFMRSVPLMQSEDVAGASPPSVFVGRIGYPYVYAGPLVPPVMADTSLYDLPEFWFGKSIDEIVGFRSMLIRGKHRVHVQKFENAGKIIEKTRELALAVNPVEVELFLKKKPKGFIVLDDEVQPFGPSAPIRDLYVGNARWDHQIEKAYSDTDLKAAEAVLELYRKGVLVTKIQRAFSVGAFGLAKNRRLVPTRWSITAVDSILSKDLMEKVKTFPEISEFRVYESHYLDNVFEVLMIPGRWSYESIEAWYPGTVWNPHGRNVVMYSDWEGYEGRTTYAEIGGCYYAARLAVCEQLVKEQRQATVIILREARPGYIMPVGVWQVRENVRNAMRQKPFTFKTLEEALNFVASRFQIPIQRWIMQSELLKNTFFQKRITDFLEKH